MISSLYPTIPHGHRSERPRISCVVPALNEHDSLLLLLPEMAELLDQISSAWEIIVVDDGSTDHTPQLMTTYVHQQPGLSTTCSCRATSGRRQRSAPGSKRAAAKW
jgi:glycosyltransferase involved in cell wall biosynthesis